MPTVNATTAFLPARDGAPSQGGPLDRRADELPAPPVSFQPSIQGVSLSIPVSAFLSLQPVGSQIRLGVRAVADLSDLQRKIGPLIDTIPLPTDNCQHFGVDNVVARLWGKRLTADGSVGTLSLSGDVDVWACAKNPVPCSRIEWDETTVFGITIRTPRTVFYDCNPPIKSRLANQPFDAALPFDVIVPDPHSIAVRLGNPSINLGGSLGGVTQGILRLAGVDLNAKVKDLLDRTINPDLLRQTLPADLLSLQPAISRAELLSQHGDLALYVEMSATVDGQAIGRLFATLLFGGAARAA